MNFDNKFIVIESEIKRINSSLDALKNDYEKARDFTSIYLQCCEKHGISLTSISKKTNLISACQGWPFSFEGSVFADERKNGHSAIWEVCSEMKISRGCGNSGQYSANCSKLIDGVYELKDGKWMKIE